MKKIYKKNAYKGVLIDLDGTLVDHFTTIHRCLNYAQKLLNLPLTDYETLRKTVGGSLQTTLCKLAGEENFDRAYELYIEHFAHIWKEDLRLIDGAYEFVESLGKAGISSAVLTNKRGDFARDVVHELKLEPFIKFTLGTRDTPYRKPQPEFTQAAMQRLGSTVEDTCLIGDGPYDVETAKAAGIDIFLVTTGTHSEAELKALGANGIFPNLDTLKAAVFGL